VYIDVKEETSQATQQNQGGGLLSIQRKTIVQQRISQACHVTERNTDVCNMASDLAAGFRKILALRTRVPLSKSGSQKSPKETLSLSLSLSLSLKGRGQKQPRGIEPQNGANQDTKK
jgi:hypothetical protein